MGKVPLSCRRGAGSIFTAHTSKRIGACKLRRYDFGERHGYIRGVVREVVHDAGRGAPVAKVQFRDPNRHKKDNELFIAVEGVTTGQFVYCGKRATLAVGNVLPVGNMPEGCIVCNIELVPGDRGRMAKAAGEYAIVISQNKEEGKTRLKLPSGMKKTISGRCRATIGLVAGGGRIEKPLLKAGNAYYKYKSKRNCWPVVRGVAMNPVEHPDRKSVV